MGLTIRKCVVGLVALAALIGVYLLYTESDQTRSIVADPGRMRRAPAADANADSTSHVGTILDVGIGRVEQTRFLHRNERNEVDRIFGFEQLLHKQGNQWEITHPYMSLLFPAFRCDVTANRGRVHVEAAFSRLTAGDASFSGNVILHIIPAEPNDAKECFIHLDDVSFLAAKSLFSSVGAVHFLSRSAQLTGTGMELLYDEGHSRLELFRIFDLDSLRLSSRALGAIADLTPRRSEDAAPAQGPAIRPTPADDGPQATPDDCYRCIFHRNVAINMPDRVVTARDVLAIDNILWSGSKKPGAQARRVLDPNDPNAAPYPGSNALKTTAPSHPSISAIPPESFDIIVTCEGGFEVTPMGPAPWTEDVAPSSPVSAGATLPVARARREPNGEGPDPRRQRATAQRIHFNALTTDTTLDGPVEMALALDPNGLPDTQSTAQAMPMTITAQKAVRFLAAADQVLFEGGCKVTLRRLEPDVTYEYILTAPRLVLEIAAAPDKTKGITVGVRKLVTAGGPATLRILRQRAGKLLGWTRLDAAQLQYEADPRQFTALGPGRIWVRNEELIDSKADPNQFSLGRPCLARLTNFDVLTYSAATNHMVAQSDAQQLLLDYFPLTDGKYDRQTRAIAGHVEAFLKEVVKGRLELASLTATQGIEYEDETSGLAFVGSSLSYDYGQAVVAVRGDDEQRCYLNGALVDQIELNLKTGRIKAEIPAPGFFQGRR